MTGTSPPPEDAASAPRERPPPAFVRRAAAADTADPSALVALACDESYWVRREAVGNPATPEWILRLLEQAGATPDLRGRRDPDPTMPADALRQLVECGSWARQLVAEHPNAPSDVLAALSDQRSISLRLAVASHPNADAGSLASLCADAEPSVRAAAADNPGRPPHAVALLHRAGASDDLRYLDRPTTQLPSHQLDELATLGHWGLFLAVRQPACSVELLERAATQEDWRVASALLDNPAAPDRLLAIVAAVDDGPLDMVRTLSSPRAPATTLDALARHPHPAVRLAVARHPAASVDVLARLVSDGERDVRVVAARHPATAVADIELLVLGGSTPDLTRLAEPGESASASDLERLAQLGMWARLLAVRHPRTAPATLAQLLCDLEPKVREWAAVHPAMPPETVRMLVRAGSSDDFQGFVPADPTLPASELRTVASLGPWGCWVAAANPHAPGDLLESLALSDDPRVRELVAANPGR